MKAQFGKGFLPYEIDDMVTLKGFADTVFIILDIRMIQYIREPKIEFEILINRRVSAGYKKLAANGGWEEQWISANVIEGRVL